MEDILRSYDNEDDDLELSADEWKTKFHETMTKIRDATEQQNQNRYSSTSATPSRTMTQVGLSSTGTTASPSNSNNKDGLTLHAL
jgi:hypothetical protein